MGSTKRPTLRNCASRPDNEWYNTLVVYTVLHFPVKLHIAYLYSHCLYMAPLWVFHRGNYTEELPVWSLSALTDECFFFLLNRQGTCRRVAGSQDGSKGTASMEHTAMSEATGRQGNRQNGLDAVTYLAVSATIQNRGCPRCTRARVSKEAVVGVDSILIFQGT